MSVETSFCDPPTQTTLANGREHAGNMLRPSLTTQFHTMIDEVQTQNRCIWQFIISGNHKVDLRMSVLVILKHAKTSCTRLGFPLATAATAPTSNLRQPVREGSQRPWWR